MNTADAEVIVVGAGPAGASCAALLAERGHDVLLIDQSRFPRDKPCGDGLTRSAVGFLERMGLEEVIAGSQPVDGLRMVIDRRTVEYRAYEPTPRSPHRARCIPRSVLDNALLQAAMSRGARFVQARVTDRIADEPPGGRGPAVTGVKALAGSEELALRSRFVVAADGATSRLRRLSGNQREIGGLAAYAVRAYFRCERALEPVFDTYMPLELESKKIAGYGWVFPIDAHTANIGVGYWRGAGIAAPTRIREVMGAFIEQLRIHDAARFGELEQTSDLFGSPLGVHFRRESCEVDGLVFVGDAARTTDPWSGEGIAYALHGAQEIAELIHRRAQGPALATLDAGTVLGRRFGRLGQDLSFPMRIAERRLSSGEHHHPGNVPHPFLRTVQHVIAAPEEAPSLLDTPAGGLLAKDAQRAPLLEEVNAILLDELRTTFPFASELLHCEVRAGLGPILAVVALLCGSPDEPRLPAAASALELIVASAAPMRELVNRPRSGGGRLNNALSVLIGDFALSRGARQGARAGVWMIGELSVMMKGLYEAQFVESQGLFDVERGIDDYVAVARARSSAPLSLAVRFAALSSGRPAQVVECLDAFARELGVAVAVCEDLEDLLIGDEASGRPRGADLRLGVYPPPVLGAAEDLEFREQLGRPVDSSDVSELLARLRTTDAMARTRALVESHLLRARAELEQLGDTVPPGLAELTTVVQARSLELTEAA